MEKLLEDWIESGDRKKVLRAPRDEGIVWKDLPVRKAACSGMVEVVYVMIAKGAPICEAMSGAIEANHVELLTKLSARLGKNHPRWERLFCEACDLAHLECM